MQYFPFSQFCGSVLTELSVIYLHGASVYSVSLRQQLQDVGKKLVGAQHYNKDGAINNRYC